MEDGDVPGWATRAALWCAGADPDCILTKADRHRFVGFGLLIACIGLVAGAGMLIFAGMVTHGFHWYLVPLAALWGFVVFLIDRQIMAEPKLPYEDGRVSPGDSGPPAGRRRSRVPAYLARVAFAFVAAVVVAEVIVLTAFAPEISGRIRERAMADVRAEAEAFLGEPATAGRPATGLHAALEEAKEGERTAKDAYTNTNSQPNPNSELQKRNQENLVAWGQQSARVRRIQERVDAAGQRLDDIESATRIRPGDTTPLPPGVAREVRIIEEREHALDGFAGRHAALDEFLKDNPNVRFWPWTLRALLLAFDLMPLVLKTTTSTASYDRARQRRDGERARRAESESRAADYAADMREAADIAATNAWYQRERRRNG
ncbi:DUF4407 domain-containing protein [Parafrankia sp. EUN1f]|uniref:DUF4407 domain-containing protein n=1 Tax=Parafrankia sp. EUN1f TaxID=102897 RepID=UPI0001C463C5|nr:DUF4407 domain-containing protein [Parafrankia sp. EUN1f]EFC81261.1 hypothetical protein FrEUN1fDRAFT_5602 [Parafrankia sp. EUN1f]